MDSIRKRWDEWDPCGDAVLKIRDAASTGTSASAATDQILPLKHDTAKSRLLGKAAAAWQEELSCTSLFVGRASGAGRTFSRVCFPVNVISVLLFSGIPDGCIINSIRCVLYLLVVCTYVYMQRLLCMWCRTCIFHTWLHVLCTLYLPTSVSVK